MHITAGFPEYIEKELSSFIKNRSFYIKKKGEKKYKRKIQVMIYKKYYKHTYELFQLVPAPMSNGSRSERIEKKVSRRTQLAGQFTRQIAIAFPESEIIIDNVSEGILKDRIRKVTCNELDTLACEKKFQEALQYVSSHFGCKKP
jgi:hypothetical protein